MAFILYLRTPGEKKRFPRQADAVVHLEERGFSDHAIHHNLEQFFSSPQGPRENVAAFLMVSLGIWVADKLIPRRETPDAWTREIVLNLAAPAAWEAPFARLTPLLQFLTGDVWTLAARQAPLDLGFAALWPHPWLPQAVVLFSGGLDSLVGAIDLLEAGKRVVLVSHYDFGQLASVQQRLSDRLRRYYGPDHLHHLGIRVQFSESPELTLRSRSLLYLALGLTAAAAFGPDTPLYVPENGWLCFNPPLTLNRLGPYSTRTTHPYFLEQLVAWWREVGISHRLLNPYQSLSKGEMLEQCRNRRLLKELYPLTISCARPEVGRWQGRATAACGYCYPCFIRRAALHRLGWDDAKDYRVEALADPEIVRRRTQGRDLRALLFALKTWEATPAEIEARLWLTREMGNLPEFLAEAQGVLKSGFQEIAHFLRDKGGKQLAAYLE
jgi:7-cyano-7-deazaguanine synthase in queuosine biosynthesis